MYLDYLEALNQHWARIYTLEEFEMSTLDDYYEFSQYLKLLTGLDREVSGYGEAQELFEETRRILLSKIRNAKK